MWISKKMWNEIGNELDNLVSRCTHNEIINQMLRERLADAEIIVENLTKSHSTIEVEEKYFDYADCGVYSIFPKEKTRKAKHYTHAISTKLIPNVTLEELAKLVIDGTPIKRTEKIDMTTEFYGRV